MIEVEGLTRRYDGTLAVDGVVKMGRQPRAAAPERTSEGPRACEARFRDYFELFGRNRKPPQNW